MIKPNDAVIDAGIRALRQAGYPTPPRQALGAAFTAMQEVVASDRTEANALADWLLKTFLWFTDAANRDKVERIAAILRAAKAEEAGKG